MIYRFNVSLSLEKASRKVEIFLCIFEENTKGSLPGGFKYEVYTISILIIF